MEPARSRTRWATRITGALVVTVATVALAACGPTSEDQVTPARYVEAPALDDSARQAYGDGAEAAYYQVADFLMDQSFPRQLLDPQRATPTQDELTAGIVEAMTPETATEWTSLVTRARDGGQEERDAVLLLRFYGFAPSGAQLPERPMSSQTVTDGSVKLGTAEDASAAPPLVISLVHDADITLTARNVPQALEVTKSLTVTVVPAPADPDTWLIAEFEGEIETTLNGTDV